MPESYGSPISPIYEIHKPLSKTNIDSECKLLNSIFNLGGGVSSQIIKFFNTYVHMDIYSFSEKKRKEGKKVQLHTYVCCC